MGPHDLYLNFHAYSWALWARMIFWFKIKRRRDVLLLSDALDLTSSAGKLDLTSHDAASIELTHDGRHNLNKPAMAGMI
jgi:hypothetical protein